MAKKKKPLFSENEKKAIAYTIILIMLGITIAEGMGYDPIAWLKKKLYGNHVVYENEIEVHFIDVGQGDCIFIDSTEKNMLIDCGEASESDVVTAYLNKLGVDRLDYVVATHPHSDHMGGMSDIITAYDVGEVIMPYLDDSDIPDTNYFEKFLDACSAKGLYITDAEKGRRIPLGDAYAEIIAPCSDNYGNVNNYSIGIILDHGDNDFLFTGDAEALAEQEMLESGMLRQVRVYKAGHHGSDTSSSPEFIEAISPEIVVVMCGANNSYGHPHGSVMELLDEYADKIYRTDISGSIVFESNGYNLQIRTER